MQRTEHCIDCNYFEQENVRNTFPDVFFILYAFCLKNCTVYI